MAAVKHRSNYSLDYRMASRQLSLEQDKYPNFLNRTAPFSKSHQLPKLGLGTPGSAKMHISPGLPDWSCRLTDQAQQRSEAAALSMENVVLMIASRPLRSCLAVSQKVGSLVGPFD